MATLELHIAQETNLFDIDKSCKHELWKEIGKITYWHKWKQTCVGGGGGSHLIYGTLNKLELDQDIDISD